MTQLGVIFIQYDQQRYADAFSTLAEVIRSFELSSVFTVIVDNLHEEQKLQLLEDCTAKIGGNNSLFEFSGWMKGWETLKELQGDCDCYLFVTDAFLAYGDQYQKLADSKLLHFLSRESAVAGLVDLPPSNFKNLQLLNWDMKCWVRSSFFFVPHSVMTQMKSLITITEIDPFCDKAFQSRAFKPEAPLSPDYQNYLEQWLTRDWHSALTLSHSKWEHFRHKIRSILNEHALTARWQAMGIPIYDLYFLKQISQDEGSPLLNLSPQTADHFRFDLIDQKDYCKPSFPERIIHKFKRLFSKT
ncbi:MAG: hypothetical protein HQM13_16200 [SAR324 cluster bacterium]|nr:hypothetical protein [SAR324 cluster bacterium]